MWLYRMGFYRNGLSCTVGFISTVSLVIITISLATEHWVHSEITRISNNNEFRAGNKSFGLFNGCEYKRSAEIESFKERCFVVFEELNKIAVNGLAYITMISLCVALLFLLLLMLFSLYSESTKSINKSVLYQIPLALNLVTFIATLTASSCYASLYSTHLKKTVLKKYEIQQGFTSQSNLGYSFWINIPVLILVLTNFIILLLIKSRKNRNRKRYGKKRNDKGNASALSLKPATTKSMIF